MQVVADIAQLFRHLGIDLGIDVAPVGGSGEVIIVECGLVGAHVAFVEQVEACDSGVLALSVLLLFALADRLFAAAADKSKQREEECVFICFHHNNSLTIPLPLMPGMG